MNRWQRIKSLWSLPTYRSRLIFFVILGVAVILASRLVQNPFWVDLLTQFAVVFIAVSLTSFVWDFLGGDPMELRFTQSFGDIDTKLDTIHHSMGVLSDLVDNNIGIERIWATRRDWEHDSEEGLAAWKERICKAKEVDIVSSTLWTRWFHDEVFRSKFIENIANGASARIVIYDPDSHILIKRSEDEKETPWKEVREMQTEITSTLKGVARSRMSLGNAVKDNLQVRLTQHYYHLAQIIRADDLMLVAIYLSGKTGSSSPTFQIRGPKTTYYLTYHEQVDIAWDRAREVSEDEFLQLLGSEQTKKE
jgi:hypothetical protein